MPAEIPSPFKAPRDLCQRSFAFSVRIVNLCVTLDERPGVKATLARQLLRSGTSIGANIEEAQGAQSRPDFISKYSIALKEARETIYWLRLLVAATIIESRRVADLIEECRQLSKILARAIITAKSRR